MSAPTAYEDRLASAVRRMLLPQRFPARRDLEIAGGTRDHPEASAFFDTFWPAAHRLAALAAHVRLGGIDGAMRASCLHRLARGAASLSDLAEPALAMIAAVYEAQFGDRDFDLALVLFDTETGALSRASLGRTFVGAADPAAGAGEPDLSRPQPGDVVWLVAGDGRAARIAPAPAQDGPDDLLRAVLAASEPGAAVVGIVFKTAARKAGEHSFVLPNDLAAIAGVTERIEAACAGAAVPEPVSMAFGLALDEILTNVVSYGYADGAAHEILVELSILEGAVEVAIRDDGRPFDPLTVPEPDLSLDLDERGVGGLGMHFVRTLLDDLDYRRDKGWNVLTLRKRIPDPDEADAFDPPQEPD